MVTLGGTSLATAAAQLDLSQALGLRAVPVSFIPVLLAGLCPQAAAQCEMGGRVGTNAALSGIPALGTGGSQPHRMFDLAPHPAPVSPQLVPCTPTGTHSVPCVPQGTCTSRWVRKTFSAVTHLPGRALGTD